MKARTTNRLLAALASLFAIGAWFAGDTTRAASQHSIDAVQLATWMREQKPGLRIIDLRVSAAFEQYHIPNAERLDPAALKSATFDGTEVVVLYGAEGSSPDVEHARGAQSVYVLQDGIRGWLSDIMSPHLPAQATPEQEQAYQKKRELAEYFGGQASRFAEPPGTPTTDQLLKQYRRRGC